MPAPTPPTPDSAWSRQLRLLGRHLRFGWRGAEVRRAALRRVFIVTHRWLAASGVEHWPHYGTLLGWFREGDILAHDRDVDFAVPLAAYDLLRRHASALPPGFTLRDTSHRHHGPKLYVEHQGWEADVYFFSEDAGHLRSLERSPNPGDLEPFPRDWVFPRVPATFLGESIHVPHETEKILRHLYRYLGSDAVRDPVTRYFKPRQGN